MLLGYSSYDNDPGKISTRPLNSLDGFTVSMTYRGGIGSREWRYETSMDESVDGDPDSRIKDRHS